MNKKIVKDAMILTAFTLVLGLILGMVNEITKGPIAKVNYEAEQESYRNVFKDADSFEEYKDFDAKKAEDIIAKSDYANDEILSVNTALDKSGEVLGYVISVTSHEGSQSDITLSVGIRNDGTLNGYSITSISETPGLGMLVQEKAFYSQFENKSESSYTVVKTAPSADNEIEAVTGRGVLELVEERAATIQQAAESLKLANPLDIVKRCHTIMQEVKDLEKERDALQAEITNLKTKSLFDNPYEVNGVKVVTAMLTNTRPDMLRKMGDELKAREADAVAVVAGVDGEKANLVVVCGKNAVAKGAHAGKIAGKVAALTGGKGGGRPDSAMAGIGDRFKIDEALDKVNEIVGEFVK